MKEINLKDLSILTNDNYVLTNSDKRVYCIDTKTNKVVLTISVSSEDGYEIDSNDDANFYICKNTIIISDEAFESVSTSLPSINYIDIKFKDVQSFYDVSQQMYIIVNQAVDEVLSKIYKIEKGYYIYNLEEGLIISLKQNYLMIKPKYIDELVSNEFIEFIEANHQLDQDFQ